MEALDRDLAQSRAQLHALREAEAKRSAAVLAATGQREGGALATDLADLVQLRLDKSELQREARPRRSGEHGCWRGLTGPQDFQLLPDTPVNCQASMSVTV